MRKISNYIWYGLLLGIGLAILYVSFRTQLHKYGRIEPSETNEPSGVVQATLPPTPTPLPKNIAVASYYDKSVCAGREVCRTASGELFKDDDYTFAHLHMQFGTRVKFCLGDGCVVCKANDRGPYIDGRSFDLSLGCANAIGLVRKGVAKVTWEKVGN